jgi:sugar phosphate isomerase/epimerase
MHQETIRAIGGAKVVADALRGLGLQIEDVTVRSWTLAGRSIPARYWTHIAAIAEERGIQFSIEDAARAVAVEPGAKAEAA